MTNNTSFKLTYASMFNPPEEFHTNFENALEKVNSYLGKEHGMFIGGREIFGQKKINKFSPINTDNLLGVFQSGNEHDATMAVQAARKAFPAWSRLEWKKRVALVRKAADVMESRLYEIGAVISLEVGKNRMEAMGDVAETVELFRYSCDQMEKNEGYVVKMGEDPIDGYRYTNTSILRPYGVWLVVSPYNFPCALNGGPAAAALIAGNTVISKPASDTPWTGYLINECLREAGLPDGVFNFVTGPGSSLGQSLIENPDVDGITFTGSFEVGMKISRRFGGGRWARPAILELGGKNPVIVTQNSDLDIAVAGIIRSAFGLQGQKCSACSRLYIEEAIYDEIISRLINETEQIRIGDPTERNNYLGPLANKGAYENYQQYVQELKCSGRILTGGKILTDEPYAKGYFCVPTIAELPLGHSLWQQEMFVPILTVMKFHSLDEAITLANNVDYGLTAGFYGSDQEAQVFFDRIEAGVTYANRPQGATTGAWPGYQPFGGWKGSGSSGKNAGGLYYLPLYMHEQIRTIVKPAGQN